MTTHPRPAGGSSHRVRIFLASLALALSVTLGPSAALAELAVGDAAPDFSLQGSDGKTYTLSGLLAAGKPAIVLAWFPKAFTPG